MWLPALDSPRPEERIAERPAPERITAFVSGSAQGLARATETVQTIWPGPRPGPPHASPALVAGGEAMPVDVVRVGAAPERTGGGCVRAPPLLVPARPAV